MDDKFYRKNDIGVNIEYTIIGYYKDEDKKYCIYTDFVTDNSTSIGLRLYVDLYTDKGLKTLSSEECKHVINKFNNDVLTNLEEK